MTCKTNKTVDKYKEAGEPFQLRDNLTLLHGSDNGHRLKQRLPPDGSHFLIFVY